MEYDIKHEDSWKATQTAESSRQKYEQDLKRYDTAVGDLADALTHSPATTLYLSVLETDDFGPELLKVTGHTLSAINGTRSALNAYSLGDETMQLEAQRNAQLAEWPQDVPGSRTGGRTRAGGGH